MGLFSLFSGPKTKSDWDQKITSLNTRLAGWQSELASLQAARKTCPKSNKQAVDIQIATAKRMIANTKGEIANAKVQRRSAPN